MNLEFSKINFDLKEEILDKIILIIAKEVKLEIFIFLLLKFGLLLIMFNVLINLNQIKNTSYSKNVNR